MAPEMQLPTQDGALPGEGGGIPGIDPSSIPDLAGLVAPEYQRPDTSGSFVAPQIINLLQIPPGQQVLLKVRVAELNRTALREIGADILTIDPSTGDIVGTQIGGAVVSGLGTLAGGLAASASGQSSGNTTAFGIFPSGDWEILFRALRRNSVVTVLAEPVLVAMSGHRASFLAGGEFPVTVPQAGGAGSTAVTVQFKPFGTQLDFVPFVLDDETIRLSVRPEVSNIDQEVGVTLVSGGTPVPGTNTRSAETTVELREGQTLAMAGLLQVTEAGGTSRIPLLGDLPFVGPLFSSTTHRREERELLVMVTPYIVAPMEEHEIPPLPGQEIQAPNDLEFYLLNRIEGRTGRPHRPTTNWDDPLHMVELMKLEPAHVQGPCGYSR
jgi:pilus assembly protein CpaC